MASVFPRSQIAPFGPMTGGANGRNPDRLHTDTLSVAAMNVAADMLTGKVIYDKSSREFHPVSGRNDPGNYVADKQETVEVAAGIMIRSILELLSFFTVVHPTSADETTQVITVKLMTHALAIASLSHPGVQSRTTLPSTRTYTATYQNLFGTISFPRNITRTAKSAEKTQGAEYVRAMISSMISSLISTIVLQIFNLVINVFYDSSIVPQVTTGTFGLLNKVNCAERLMAVLSAFRKKNTAVKTGLQDISSITALVPVHWNTLGSGIISSQTPMDPFSILKSKMEQAVQIMQRRGNVPVTFAVMPKDVEGVHDLDTLHISVVPNDAIIAGSFMLPDSTLQFGVQVTMDDIFASLQDDRGNNSIHAIFDDLFNTTTSRTALRRHFADGDKVGVAGADPDGRITAFLQNNEFGLDDAAPEALLTNAGNSRAGALNAISDNQKFQILKALYETGFVFCTVVVSTVCRTNGSDAYLLLNGSKLGIYPRTTTAETDVNAKNDVDTYSINTSIAIAPETMVGYELYTLHNVLVQPDPSAQDAVAKVHASEHTDAGDISNELDGHLQGSINGGEDTGANVRHVSVHPLSAQVLLFKTDVGREVPDNCGDQSGPNCVLAKLRANYREDPRESRLHNAPGRLPIMWENRQNAQRSYYETTDPNNLFWAIKEYVTLDTGTIKVGESASTGPLA